MEIRLQVSKRSFFYFIAAIGIIYDCVRDGVIYYCI